MKLNNTLIIILVVFVLFFQYPLMSYYQHNDKTLENYSQFSVTTGRGEPGYSLDTNWFGKDIESVYHNPGFYLKDSITYEHRNEIIPLQNSLPFLMHAILYAFLQNISLTLIIGSIISTIIIIVILIKISEIIQKKKKKKKISVKNKLLLVISFFTLNYGLWFYFVRGIEFTRPGIGYVGRFININHIVIFLLLWFYILLKITESEKPKIKQFILLGVMLSVLQYTYIYFFISAIIFTGVALIIKFGINKTNIKNIFITYGILILLAIPYIINYFKYSEFNKEYMLRAGADHLIKYSFVPHIIALFLLGIILIAINYFYIGNKKKRIIKTITESYLPISLFVTSFIVLNLELFLGYNVQPHHWLSAFIEPICIIILIAYYEKFFDIIKNKKIKKVINFLTVVFIVVLFLLAAIYLSQSAKQWYKYYYFDTPDTELINFMKETPEDSVLFADTHYVTDFAALNADRRSLLGHALHTRINNTEEIHKRLIYGYKSMGFSEERLLSDINESLYFFDYSKMIVDMKNTDYYKNHNYVFFYYPSIYLTNITEVPSPLLIDSIKKEWKTANENYKLDYIIYSVNIKSIDNKNVVFQNSRYKVKVLNN